MKYRRLGKSGIQVSEIGYGAWGIGGKQWKGGTDSESLTALSRAFELGVNFIDTALAYGDGHSERLVGQVAKNAPHHVYIATKVPPKNGIWPASPETPIDEVFPYDYVIKSTEESLRNLNVETIFLQQLHVWTDAWVIRDEWRRAFEDLKTSGKVQAVGISLTEHDPDSGVSVVQTGLIDVVQVIYNIWDQTPETRLLPACREHRVGVIARVPLDEGGLTDSFTADASFEGDEFRAWYFRGDRPQQVVQHRDALKADLKDVPGTLAEIALQFCLSNPAVSTVIPGMRRTGNVECNCSVSDRGPLPSDVLERLKRHAWYRNFYL